MAKIEGHGIPTKFKPGNRGDIYTDLNTGNRYKCLGTAGFVNSDAVEEPIEYKWSLLNSGGGASSWNELEDKPFECVMEKEIRMTYIPPGEDGSVGTSELFSSFEIGDIFTIIYDGIKYENLYVGNDGGQNAIFGDYPFYICVWDGKLWCNSTDVETEHTIIIQKINVKHIDRMFMPKNYNMHVFHTNPNVELYEDPYLYTDMLCTEKATGLDLYTASRESLILIECGWGVLYPVAIMNTNSYIEVVVQQPHYETGELSTIKLYSAEYEIPNNPS